MLFIQSTADMGSSPESLSEIPPPTNPYLEDFIHEYDLTIQDMVHDTPGAAIVIVRGDSIVFSKGYGVRSINTGDSIDINTVFRIGSLSKGFASVLTGIFYQNGSIDYDDPVVQHYSTFQFKSPESTRALTVRHVLSQSTGLPYQAYTTLIEDGISLDIMLNELQHLELIGNPGQYYSYQNVGYSLIEKVLENNSSSTYEELLKEKIFTPLHMSTASSSFGAMISTDNKAMPHIKNKQSWLQRSISPNYYNTQAAGGINASITDMGQWLKALLGHREDVIAQATLDTLYTPYTLTNVRYKYFNQWPKVKKTHYGLGWRIVENGTDTVIYHGGYVNEFCSKIALIPSEGIGVCVLTNSSNSFIGKSIPEFLKLYDQYRDSIKTWQVQQDSVNILAY